MTAAEFKRKWSRYQGKETSAYQSHFDDLCRLLGQPTPNEADPSGTDFFCYQKRVVKDAELFELHDSPDDAEPAERGFADVWKKGCFAWEYKGKKRNLDEAYKQLLRYRESLLNPPLLVVCDFDRYIVRTNFNGTVQETHEFTNDLIDRPENLRLLRALFEDPDFLKPQRTTAQVTEKVAGQIAEVARSLQSRESVELADTHTRDEFRVGQRKNLRIARFLNRIVFCFFAEDTGLLPKELFTELLKTGIDDLKHFAVTLEKLFKVMAKGGTFGVHKIRHFNGHLFEDSTVFELTEDELRTLADASGADWQFIQPSIMGTLFQRALDESQRAALGAQYTSETDIRDLVEPVLMAPLRREWMKLKRELTTDYSDSTDKKAPGKPSVSSVSSVVRTKLAAFLKKLRALIVMDPACGSGNFLYVSLQMLLDLEKEVINFATQLGFRFELEVGVQQLRAIEINPYAFELAQVSVQIGFLQWRRDNGFDNDRSPVLQNLDGFHNEDALLVPHFHSKAKTLKQAQAGEHAGDDALKFYTEREWPAVDVIVSNPPFLGGSKLWKELGRHYQQELWRVYDNRVAGAADLCCYWFAKAREQIEQAKCKRVGLLATQGIRGGASREVLKRIKGSGDIFFAESDRDWVLNGAAVHVSMIGFDDGTETTRILNRKSVKEIHSNLTAHADVTTATRLNANSDIAYSGTKKSGDFDVEDELARSWLASPNPHGKPNSDLLRPWLNGSAIVKRLPPGWIIDTGTDLKLDEFALYDQPHAHAFTHVKPQRDENKREHRRLHWWLHAETCPGMRAGLTGHLRFLATPRVSKFRIFAWFESVVLPDDGIYVFARSDDYFFGVVHSRIHEVWALSQGTQVRERESGFRYTANTCFETFPFPFPDDLSLPPPSAVRHGIFVETTHQKNTGSVGAAYSAPDGAKPESTDTGYKDSAPDGAAERGVHAASTSNLQATVKRPEGRAPLTPEKHRAAIAAAAKELNEMRERWLNPPEWTETRFLEFPGTVGGPWDHYIDKSTIHEVGRVTPCAPSSASQQRRAEDCPPYLVGTVRYPRLEPREAKRLLKAFLSGSKPVEVSDSGNLRWVSVLELLGWEKSQAEIPAIIKP